MLQGLKIAAAAAMLGTLTLPASAVETINLTIASSHPLTIPWVGPLKTIVVDKSNERLEAMGSNYRINWTEAFGGSLYGFNDTLEAVADGLTDMGWIGSLFEPAKLPLQNIMYSTPFATTDVSKTVAVMNALNQKSEAMKAEWAANNIVFLGVCVSDGYHLFTKKPITKLEDLQGLKILGAASAAPWLEGTGATLVATGLPAQYSQLQTGVGDGSLLIATGAWPLKIPEVAPYVTVIDTGPLTFGGFGVNKDKWESLPEDVKKVLTELGNEYSLENARLIEERTAAAFAAMKESGATVSELPAAERQRFIDSMPNVALTWVETNEKGGVPARQIMKDFMAEIRAAGDTPGRDWDAGL
jgi:TRAP-type C4-dicarboxylate transport system substrate-binding protein